MELVLGLMSIWMCLRPPSPPPAPPLALLAPSPPPCSAAPSCNCSYLPGVCACARRSPSSSAALAADCVKGGAGPPTARAPFDAGPSRAQIRNVSGVESCEDELSCALASRFLCVSSEQTRAL